MFPYDAKLATIVREVPQTISDVVRILHSIDATCVDTDGLKWFNWLYLQVTEAVATRTSAISLTDPAWIVELDVQFARLYLSAADKWFRKQAPPDCWRVMLERRNQSAIARIQFALSGVNAHINHDLPQAIVSTCVLRGTSPQHGGTQYRDYTALNSTMEALIDAAKSTLNLRLPGQELPPVNHIQDTIAAWKLGAARESAWKNAEHLWQLRGAPLMAAGFREMLDGMSAVIGKTLLVPVPFA